MTRSCRYCGQMEKPLSMSLDTVASRSCSCLHRVWARDVLMVHRVGGFGRRGRIRDRTWEDLSHEWCWFEEGCLHVMDEERL
jgi:hypothetical protein